MNKIKPQKIVNKYFKGIILTDKQRLALWVILQNKINELLFCGELKSGRTFIILIGLILLCIKYKGLKVLISGGNYNIKCLWKDVIDNFLSKLKRKYKINRCDYFISIGKSNIYFVQLDHINNFIVMDFSIIYLDQAIGIKEEDRDILKTRLNSKIKKFNNFIIYDTNPGKVYIRDKKTNKWKMNYLYKEFYKEKNDERFLLEFNIKDTPYCKKQMEEKNE